MIFYMAPSVAQVVLKCAGYAVWERRGAAPIALQLAKPTSFIVQIPSNTTETERRIALISRLFLVYVYIYICLMLGSV